MSKHSKVFPILITIATPLIFLGVMRAGYQQNIGPLCELNENFASPGRPAHAQHCKCLGIKYFESPSTPRPAGSNATRCFGVIKKSWSDTDEAALKEVKEKERSASNTRMFERLPLETQEKIRSTYKKLQQSAFRHDYPLMLEQSRAILLEVDDYGETRGFEAQAKKATEPKAETPVLDTIPLSDPATETGTHTATGPI